MQSTMRWLCEQLTGVPRLAAADIFLAFSFVGTVNVWRGVWNLCDVYFLPGKPRTRVYVCVPPTRVCVFRLTTV